MLKCGLHEGEMLLCIFLRSGPAPKFIDVAEKMHPFGGEISNDKAGHVLAAAAAHFKPNGRLISVK